MQPKSRVIISNNSVEIKSGISQKTGKPWTIREQIASLDGPRFRMPLRLTLGDKQEPFAPGTYEIDFDASLAVGRFGEIQWERSLQLVAVGKAA